MFFHFKLGSPIDISPGVGQREAIREDHRRLIDQHYYFFRIVTCILSKLFLQSIVNCQYILFF